MKNTETRDPILLHLLSQVAENRQRLDAIQKAIEDEVDEDVDIDFITVVTEAAHHGVTKLLSTVFKKLKLSNSGENKNQKPSKP